MKRVLACAALMLWSTMAAAVVYKWTDAQGKTQYGDRPPDGVHAEVVELYTAHTARPAAPSSSSAARPISGVNPGNPAGQDKDKKAVDADVAAAREKQCSEAQARYKHAVEGRRLFRVGDDGSRQYLTSEEIDSERLNAKRDVDTACGESSQ